MSKTRTIDDDLDDTLRSGYGRRVFAWIIEQGLREIHLSSTPELTAYDLGARHMAHELNEKLKYLNPDAWLIMQREIIAKYQDELPPPADS